jgi:hypothetical protein
MYLLRKYDGTNNQFAITLKNYLEVEISDKSVSYGLDFKSNNQWRYLSVNVQCLSTTQSTVTLFLDTIKILTGVIDAQLFDNTGTFIS